MQFEFVLEEVRQHVIVAEGASFTEARKQALEIYHDRARRSELSPYWVSKPRVASVEERK